MGGAGMHCLVFESMWHVMFGMPERLSTRGTDATLPAFLRLPELDDSDLPGRNNMTLYLSNVANHADGGAWMEELLDYSADLTGANTIGFSGVSGPGVGVA